jgi:hypothetical protein
MNILLRKPINMSREFTVLLKQEKDEKPPSRGGKLFGFVNAVVKSPLFVFLFGASAATLYPALKIAFTPTTTLEAQRIRDEAKEDAVLIAPFISNLDASAPGKFEASRAALQALAQASRVQSRGDRPMFVAVNSAIAAVAVQLRPPTNKAALTPDVNQNISNTATLATGRSEVKA